MGILIPNITNAKDIPCIEVKTLEIKNIYEKNDTSICKDWNLTKADVEAFFKTAEPFAFSAQFNEFDILNCEASGELIFNGVNRKYSINHGGSAFIYGFGTEQQGYGCREGECLKYVDYVPFDDED